MFGSFPSSATVNLIRESYPVGCRVELVEMEDAHAPQPGTLGTVQFVDDIGTVFVHWDTGSSLGVVYGADKCRRV